jgi:penicillin-insensitive murein endopeptidase
MQKMKNLCAAALLLASTNFILTSGALRTIAAETSPLARNVFGSVQLPSAQPTKSISTSPTCGCIAGSKGLPIDGDHWQVMRLQRNRRWGHPFLITYIESLSERAYKNGWNGILIGDLSQPRGGPMKNGHASHQSGIDVDIWLDEMPNRRLTENERNNKMQATSVLKPKTNQLDGSIWNDKIARLIHDAAQDDRVARIFVTPAIKKALCNCKAKDGSDTVWLRRLRPWWGHDDHIHVRLLCPRGEACAEQEPPPEGDGCDDEVQSWLDKTSSNILDDGESKPLALEAMPKECIEVLNAPNAPAKN